MTEYPIGDAGRDYMREVLDSIAGAGPALARIVARPGRLFAPLPENLAVKRVMQFEAGGVSSLAAALQWLRESLEHKPPGMLLLLDSWAAPADLSTGARVRAGYFTDGANVFHYAGTDGLDVARLAELHKQVISYQLVGFYVAGRMPEEQIRSHQAPGWFVTNLLDDIRMILVSAYDQEAFLVWEAAH